MSGNLIFAQFHGCNNMNGILSARMNRNILSPKSCSLCSYVCISLPGPAHPPHSQIFSQIIHTNKQLDRIYGCEEGVLVLVGQYIYMSRENKTLETEYFWQTEREGGIHNIRLCGKTLVGLPFSKNLAIIIRAAIEQPCHR